jgi:hypothetical protein
MGGPGRLGMGEMGKGWAGRTGSVSRVGEKRLAQNVRS